MQSSAGSHAFPYPPSSKVSMPGREHDLLTAERPIEVSQFSAPASWSPSQDQKRPSSSRWSRVLGLVGTLSLHGVAIQTIIAGSDFHKPRPPEVQGAEVGRVDHAAAPAEERV